MIFGKGVWNCDEVKWSGQRSPEVAKDLATLTQFQTVLHGLLSFLSHFPSHQGAWLNSPRSYYKFCPCGSSSSRGLWRQVGDVLRESVCCPNSSSLSGHWQRSQSAALGVFACIRTVPGCWLIISCTRTFHSKLCTIFLKTMYDFLRHKRRVFSCIRVVGGDPAVSCKHLGNE